MLGIHFTGLVVKRLAARIQYDDVRDVAPVELLNQLLLRHLLVCDSYAQDNGRITTYS
jgi:hypothetical protein